MNDAKPMQDEILKIIGLRFEQPALARAWFSTEPLPGFGEATAQLLVEAGRGQEFLDYIAAVDAGIHA